MTRTHVARRLLEHGPLTEREFVEITGWSFCVAEGALRHLLRRGTVRRFCERGTSRYLYGLAA